MYSIAHPNRTYMNMGRTIASQRKIGNKKELRDIKICVDVSGSVSEDTLNGYLSEINAIFKYFEVDGELIYWSTMVGDVGNFSELKDMLKVKPKSTGGTDVRCVFDYLSGKTKVNGKHEETKVRDISCVLIITDGCFNTNYEDYARTFGNKTIWMLDGNYITFDRLFGKVISLLNDKGHS